MLCHLHSNSIFGLIILISTLVVCHTVAPDSNSNDSNLEVSQVFPSAKRQAVQSVTEGKFNSTPNSILSDDNETSALTGNPSVPSVGHPIEDGGSNITQSLPKWMTTIKSGALERTGFVFLGFMLIVIAVFVVRGIRLRHKRSKSRKYGIITSTDMEMEPLDKDEDEEEDLTLFDAQHKYTVP